MAAPNGGAFVLAASNDWVLRGATSNDLLIFTGNSNQDIMMGCSNNSNIYVAITSNAFVGIGLSNPGFRMDVAGDLNFSGTLRKGGVPYVGSQWSNVSSNVFLIGSNVGIGVSNAQAALHVASNLRVDGAVQIGTSNPQYQLSVLGSASVSSNLWVANLASSSNPAMTAGSSGGYTATASMNSGSAWNVFDKSGASTWNSGRNAGSDWVQLQYPVPAVLTYYTIVTNQWTDLPTGWTVSGSTDGTNFWPIDVQSGQSVGYSQKGYAVSTATACTYFRLTVTAGGVWTAISEIELFAQPATSALTTNGNISCTGAIASASAYVGMPSASNPAMTGASTLGYTASASINGTSAWSVFDKSGSSSWNSGRGVGSDWVQLQYPAAAILTSYSIVTNQWTDIPTGWTVSGSSDGVTFIAIDTRSGQSIGYNRQSYTVGLNKPFTYFRLTVTAGGAWTSIYEIEFFSVPSATSNGLVLSTTNSGIYCAGGINAGSITSASLSTNGAVYSNGTSLTNVNPSDERLKKNIEEMGSVEEILRKLRPVSFEWRGNGEKQYGFVAQELSRVLPEGIVKEDGSGMLGYDPIQLVPFCVRAIQELYEENRRLRSLLCDKA